MWKKIVQNYSDGLPDFNNYLIKGFRQDKVRQIPEYLDKLFHQSIEILKGIVPNEQAEYRGYVELSPKERIEYLRERSSQGKRFDIRPTKSKMVQYTFRFNDEDHHMVIEVPYIYNEAVLLEGIEYYPIFAIIEKGGMTRFQNEIVLQVMRARLKFWRNDRGVVRTTDGDIFKEVNVTCKLHQSNKGKRKRPPILVYHLCKFGFEETMKYYGVHGRIALVYSETVPQKIGKKYVGVGPSIFLEIDEDIVKNSSEQYCRRIVVSLMNIYQFNTSFKFQDLLEIGYYRVTLGKWTYPSVKPETLLYNNATTHLSMNESMLDPAAQHQHRSIGIDSKNLDHLLLLIFQNIDKWLTNYVPNDLYEKKIGTLDQMMAGLVRNFNNRLFKSIVNSKTKLKRENIVGLMKSVSRSKWLNSSSMFRSKPTFYNPNWLLTVGGKQFRSIDNTELSDGGNYGRSLPIELLRAHPSQISVVSILSYPSSNLVVSGTINPFLKIDSDGNIIKPENFSKLEKVFD